MNTVKIIILSFSSIAFGLTSLGAQAACSTANMAGNWRVFSVTGTTDKQFQGVGRGTLVFRASGALDTTKSSFILSNGNTVKLTKGQAKVNPACNMTGTFESSSGGTVITVNLFDGKMNSNKNVISGVYRLVVQAGGQIVGRDTGLSNLIK